MRQGPARAEPYSHRRIDRNAPSIIAIEPERATRAAACCNTGRSRTCRRSRSWTSPARSHRWGSNSRMGHRTLASERRSVSCFLRCSSVNHRRGAGARSGQCTGCQAGRWGKVALLRPCHARSSRERGRYVPQCRSSAARATRQTGSAQLFVPIRGRGGFEKASTKLPSRSARPRISLGASCRPRGAIWRSPGVGHPGQHATRPRRRAGSAGRLAWARRWKARAASYSSGSVREPTRSGTTRQRSRSRLSSR
jgi:hypothetical protein